MTTASPATAALKAFRYDRSELLWGAGGQARLSSARVVALGLTATVAEALKNLILPGLNRFLIVDDGLVTSRDLGTNFFLSGGDLGRRRADAAVRELSELNPSCEGQSCATSLAAIFTSDASIRAFLTESEPTLLLVSSIVSLTQQQRLAAVVRASPRFARVAIVSCLTNGLCGLIRVDAGERFVVDAVTDADLRVVDFRVLNPFSRLREFYERLDPAAGTVDSALFNHIPYMAVIYHALKRWRAAEGKPDDAVPSGYTSQWQAVLKPHIESFARTKTVVVDEGAPKEQRYLPDSFLDAINQLGPRLNVGANRNAPELYALLKDQRATNPGPSDDPFWFVVHGVAKFRERHGGLMPVAPTIPDVETTTDLYRELQAIFRDQAAADATEVHADAQRAATAAGCAADHVSFETARHMCGQVWDLRALSFPSTAEQCASMPWEALDTRAPEALRWYAALIGAEVVAEQRGANGGVGLRPGESLSIGDHELPLGPEEALLRAAVRQRCSPDWYSQTFANAVELSEIVRFGGGEPTPVASIVGAVTAQECVKLLQGLRVPLCFAAVYDGHANVIHVVDAKR